MSNPPANPRFMPATRDLLEHLYGLWGHWTLSGQSNTVSWQTRYSDAIEEHTRCRPAIWGCDFGYSPDRNDDNYVGDRDTLIDEAIRQHQTGSIIQLDFRPCNPVYGEPRDYRTSLAERIGDRDWEAMLTPGTSVFTRWRQQLDMIGVFLRYLKDMDIVVLFRPCPCMNTARFWWGGRPGPSGFAGLWRSIYDYYVQNLRLDNLLFVWSAEAGGADPDDFYPGHGMVDILGCDVYDQAPPDGFYPQERFELFRKLGDGRPVALTRCGPLPDNRVLVRQRWLWFMAQAAAWENHHRPEDVRILYSGDYLLHRNDWAAPHRAR